MRFFGEFEAVEGGVPVPVRGAKQRTVLALLALHRGKPVSADLLIDALWGDGQVANPVNALQAQIGQLRRTLGATAIVTSDAGDALDIGPDDLDAARFEQLVAKGRRLLEDGEMALASTALGEALQLRGGSRSPSSRTPASLTPNGRYFAEVTLVAARPGSKPTWRWAVTGNSQANWRRCAGNIRCASGCGSCSCSPSTGPAARPRPCAPTPKPVTVWSTSWALTPARPCGNSRPASWPRTRHSPQPPRQVSAVPAPMATGNLRERLSSFVGRTAELQELSEAVRSSRLVTLIGPGGVGKTRLAVEAAATLREEHRDGAWLVEFASVTEPGGVAPAVAGALGAAVAGLVGPPSPDSTVELIVRFLAGRSLVVVLDNCEHVIGQAAALAETLAGTVPGLRLIATSREPLGVPGEVLVPVGPLALPAAVELFVDRARAVRPGFTADGHTRPVIDDICRRLDGLPLAVELAAARLRSLTLATLAERLDDRFRLLTVGARTALPRQQTLRAVVDWSYDLLFEDERRLFARLSVFVGGCDLDAAEAVCADDQVPAGEILDILSRLVDKSLVTAPDAGRDARFIQLQTLWQYGRDRLDESGEAGAMCARHAAYYRQMAEEAHEGLRGATGPMWRERLISELGNLRAAFDWFIAKADADAALSLASGMAWVWFINSDCVEGARWLGDALSATGPRRPELAATAQVWHGFCVCMAFSPAAAVPECDAALAALRTSGDRVRRAEALLFCGTVLMRALEFERSLGALSEAHDLLEPGVHGWLRAYHDWIVAENLTLLAQFDGAEPAARSSVERFDAQGEVWMSVGPLQILAGIAAARGDLDGGSAAYEALLERSRAAGQRLFEMFSLSRLAALRAKQGDDAAADGVYEEAIACSFDPSVSADLMVGQATVARRLGDLARARALLDAAGTYYRDVGLHAGQTGVLVGLAWWALSAGQADDAMVFAADACQAAAASGDPAVQLLADTAVAAVRALADPTRPNIEAFVALAQQRAQNLGYGSLTSYTDEPDVAALAARLALPSRSAATRR